MNESVDRVTLQWWIDHATALEQKNKELEQRVFKLEETISILREELHRIIQDKDSPNS
jgi:hypothetical protein